MVNLFNNDTNESNFSETMDKVFGGTGSVAPTDPAKSTTDSDDELLIDPEDFEDFKATA